MNKEKQERSSWLIYSITLHSLALIALLISLNETSLFNKNQPAPVIVLTDKQEEMLQKNIKKQPTQEKKTQPLDPKTFNVPVPVMYYGKELDPNKTPGTPTKKQTETEFKKTEPLPPLHQEESHTKETLLKKIESEITEILEEVKKEKTVLQEPLLEVKEQATQTLPKKSPLQKTLPETIPPKEKTPGKKQLTLADLFNKSPLTSTDTQMIGEGSGQPIVIKEGDMKYYSVWSKFLNHLNQTARFNRIKKKVPLMEWIKNGLLKKDLFCGITVTKEGKVLAIDIISSSGFKTFDDMCIQDIWASSPFPPLPESMGKEQARFEVRSYL